jgi:hypothetical protein
VVCKAIVILFENAFSTALPNLLSFILGYFVPFKKMVNQLEYPTGTISFINVTTPTLKTT